MKVTKVMIVLRSLALMIVLTMVTVLMVPVFVRMVGEVMIVLVGALVMVRGAVVMVSVLRESAIATLDGLVMLVTFALACTIALNTVIAQMVLAFAKRVTEVVIALSQLNLNLVNVPSTVCVGVCNNVLRCMRPKELVLLMSATPSALRSVCLSVLLVNFQLLCLVPLLFLLIPLMLSHNLMKALLALPKLVGCCVRVRGEWLVFMSH
jgi:hypothetical protein